MSTIFRFKRLRIAIYSNDHPPPHVHVIGPDREARIVIGDESKPPAVWDFYGFQRRELIQVLHEVARRQDELLTAWRTIHG
jgi:hypothetical protein